MSIGAIEAGKAFVRLLVNDTELQKGLTRAQTKLKMFAASTGQLGRQMLGLSAALGAPLIAGAKAYADFESQMAQVSTMLDDPAQFMGAFSEGVKRLAVEFGESTDVLAGGLYEILSASIEPAKAMGVLTAAVKAAKAGLSDTATATSAITTIMNAYGMRADQATEISDWLFQVVKRGQSTFAELAPSIGNVATIAATAGVSLNELGAIFSVITRAGVQTDEAITAINAIISTFLDPADEAAQIAKQLGINLSVSALQSEGLLKIFQKIGSLPPDILAKLFPNIRALKGVLPALRNLEGFEEDMAALGNSAGSTEEAYKKLADTLTAKFNQVKQAIVMAAAEIGAAMKVDIAEGAKVIKDIGAYVADWVKNHQGLVIVLGKSAIAIAAVGGALLAMAAIANTTAFALGGLALASKAAAASFAFLMANPAVFVLGQVAIALVAVSIAMDSAAASALKLSGAQQGLLDAGDKKRQQDKDYLNRLQALSSKEKLTNRETKEAASIIQYLESAYGDLGLTLDSTTGKISGVAGAYSKMNAAMKEGLKSQLKASLKETRANQQAIADELKALHEMRGITPMFRSARESELGIQAAEWKAKHDALMERYKDVLGAATDEEGGGEKGSYTAAVQLDLDAGKRKEKAAKDAADFKKGLDERMHEAKLAMIDDEYKRELEAIKAKHQAERIAAQKTGQDMAALMAVQQIEVGNVHREQRKKREEEQRRADEKKAENQKDLQQEIEELQIKSQTKGLDQQLKLLELQRRRALAESPITGEPIAAINRKFDLMAQLAKMEGAAPIEERVSVAGTFSAQQAARMGASSIEERQLRTQEEIRKNTAETTRAVSALGRLGP